MKLRLAALSAAALLGAATAQAQQAPDPLTLQFSFCQVNEGGPGEALGYITFDRNFLDASPDLSWDAQGGAVLDLQMVVQGTGTGDGSFGLADFDRGFFQWNGGTPNYDQELVGQPTDGAPFGTDDLDDAGDFNFFRGTQAAPNGVWWFTLLPGGAPPTQEEPVFNVSPPQSLVLTSLIQGSEAIPESACSFFAGPENIPSTGRWGQGLLVLLLLGLGGLTLRRIV